jgi:uncharacterized protein (DUF983 family)
MISKGNKIYSVLHSKCPKCNEGDVFESKNPYNLKEFASMYANCSVCAQSTQPEPGFYYGAMYVSYALTVGLGIVVGGLMLFFDYTPMATIAVLSVLLVVLAPVSFRLSRMIWFNMFYHYDKNVIQKNKTV